MQLSNNTNYFSSNFTLGILGGGQLGKMLLTEIRKFDIKTFVLDPNEDAPSQFGAHQFFLGDLMDFETVYNFGKKVDLLTFENKRLTDKNKTINNDLSTQLKENKD